VVQCRLQITPGSTPSSNGLELCSTGVAPDFSSLFIYDSFGAIITIIKIYVLDYGCLYQGGYIFSIDDNTNLLSSIGGKVVSATAVNTSSTWASPAYGVVWSINDTSTATSPSPNEESTSTYTTPYLSNQLNCDAVNDGLCATYNIGIYAQANPSNTFAATSCQTPQDSNATACTGGDGCYTDWYLPSICDLAPFSNTGSQTCFSLTENIYTQLATKVPSLIPTSIGWSSTSYSSSASSVWALIPTSPYFEYAAQTQPSGVVRCVRNLNN